MRWIAAIVVGLVSVQLAALVFGDVYRERRETVQARDPSKRKVPEILAKGRPIRCIIDTDAKNEIDDVWAVALALMCPERFRIEGFVAANYDNTIEYSEVRLKRYLLPRP